jgi:hypothetical protein
LNFTNDRRDVPSEAISIGLHTRDGTIANVSKPWIAEDNTASFSPSPTPAYGEQPDRFEVITGGAA